MKKYISPKAVFFGKSDPFINFKLPDVCEFGIIERSGFS